jgi:hypothetical protein
MAFDAEKRVAQFVALRDEIKRMDDAYAESKRPFLEMKERLEAELLKNLQETNSEGIRTKAGTVYISTRDSASLEDPEAFMKYVIENNAFDLMDRKANTTAVRDFIEEHHAPPPGAKFSSRQTVGVRRS